MRHVQLHSRLQEPSRATTILGAACLVVSSGVVAQGSLYPDVRLEVGRRARGMASGDVNSDGIPDLVAVNDFGDISVLLGRGDGTFEDERRSRLGDGAYDLALRDLNRDGVLDVAVHGYYQDYVAIALGNGDGTFGPEARFPTGYRGQALATGDFNGDGFEDLVSPNRYDSSVSVLLGRGDGAFEEEFRLPAGLGSLGVGTGDVNGDGLDDVIVANTDIDDYYSDGDDDISVYLAIGDGSFALPVLYAVGKFPFDVTVADWNGDGQADLAVASYDSRDVSILMGQGGGALAPLSRIHIGGTPEELIHADVNKDGMEDLIVAAGHAAVLLGNGDGTFSRVTGSIARGITSSVAVADLDADGHLDLGVLLLGHSVGTPSTVALRYGDGTGTSFTARPQQHPRHGVGDAPSAIVTADLDGDGHLDLVTTNRGSHDLSVLTGLGDGGFLPESRFPGGSFPDALEVADLNADMLPDLAVLHKGSGQVRVLLGEGDGSFQYAQAFSEQYLQDILVTDVTTDGRDDLVMLRSGELIVLPQGIGGFGAGHRAPSNLSARALAPGDLNLDGLPDLVVIGRGEAFVHLGRGDGTFEPAIVQPSSPDGLDVLVGDFTGDGIPDVVKSTATGHVPLYPGDGQGSLDNTNPNLAGFFATGDWPLSLLLADLNGDGQSDIVSANRDSDDVSVLVGQTRSLARQMRFEVGGGPTGVAWGDFNEDGRPDLAVANSHTDDVSILLNQSLLSNLPPDAHADGYVGRDCASGLRSALLDAGGSVDLNSSPGTLDDIVTFEWWLDHDYPEPDVLLGTTPMLQVTLPMEELVLRLEVTDSHGHRDSSLLPLDLTDTAPPSISVTLSKDVLWPPNHRLVDVDASVDVVDECDGVQVVLESVASSEPDDAPGGADGATADDVAEAETGTADITIQLRAERDGSGDGRTYTVTYRASDTSGNSATVSALVSVPHDQGGSVDPLILGVDSTATGTVVHWNPVSGAMHYNVIRGRIEAIHETANAFHLVHVNCLEGASVNTDTTGFEDAETPSSGEMFFYLVAYFDGEPSSYGTASAAKERIALSGDCR